MFFKKDIYKALRPNPEISLLGFSYKKIFDVDYKDALLYPRFKFLDIDKPFLKNGIFETSDYKEVFKVLGNRTLSVGTFISYKKLNYQIVNIEIDILDIVIDYSNGHTDYYIGNAIPFNVEISISVKYKDFWDITMEFVKKHKELMDKDDLSDAEKIQLINNKFEAERCFKKILTNFESDKNLDKAVVDIYRAYGIFKSDCKEYLEAIKIFTKALEIDPLNSQLLCYIGYEYGMINNNELCIQFLKRAIELGSNEAYDYMKENNLF